MKKPRLITILTIAGCICLGLLCAQCLSATLFVRPDGNDGNSGASWDAAKKTIQSALNAAASGSEIWVAAGTYRAYSASTHLTIVLKTGVGLYGGFSGNETLRSQRDPSLHPTIIDGSIDMPSSGIVIPSGVSGTVVDGFTIRNCVTGPSASGLVAQGAITCASTGPNLVSNNLLVNNDYGVCAMSAGATVLNNRIIGNTKGGINGPITLAANNVICGNSGVKGGGIYAKGGTFINNTIIGNCAGMDGGGIYADGTSTVIVSNNIIAFNSSGVSVATGTPTAVKSNCVYSNTAYNYLGITDPTGTNGNISQDPKPASRLFGNAHIQPDSPCVDAGDDSALSLIPADYLYDMDHQPRTIGSHADIGADESSGEAWSDVVPAIIKASPTGDDTLSGLSWSTAKKTIQAAIDTAATTGGEVWVAGGTYNECIALKPYVYIYGGFSGLENSRLDRDWAANKTIIDAKRGGTVVSAYLGHDISAIDGFTIRGGASNSDAGCSQGSGIVCSGSSATIANNTIMLNSGIDGGGIYCADAAPKILNNVIQGNWAERGGGIYCGTGFSTPSTLVPTLINNTISANKAVDGGGVYCELTNPILTNNIIAANSSGVFATSSMPAMKSNCVYGNKDYNCSGTTDPTGNDGNISQDPLLAAPDYGNVHIQPNSPCKDAGDNSVLQPDWADMDHQTRVLDGRIDIGADESNGAAWDSAPVIHVAPSGDDAHDGSTWSAAKRTVKAGIDTAARTGGQVWVAGGTYTEQIELPGFVNVYGGFAGGEATLGDRDPSKNPTIIDGSASGSVVSSYAGPGALDGFTLRNGKGTPFYTVTGYQSQLLTSLFQGGGVFSPNPMLNLASCTITANSADVGAGFYGRCPVSGITFSGNSATGNGGGIYSYGPFGGISNCTITSNSAVSGGGIAGQCSITGCSINANTASQDGGGVFGADAVSGCTISKNTAARNGGGVWCPKNNTIAGNIIAKNIAGSAGGGLRLGGTAISNTIVDNTAPQYGGVSPDATSATTLCDNIVAFNSGAGSLSGNLTANYIYDPADPNDPAGQALSNALFVDPPRGDYHLRAGSPCIDAGTNYEAIFQNSDQMTYLPSRDIDGQKRVYGQAIDIGADEWWPCPADAKKVADAGTAQLSGITVTAAFPDFFYVETDDRGSGIRVNKAGHGLSTGTRVDVSGISYTDDNGERCIAASSVTQTGLGNIVPLGLNNKTLGGGDFGLQEGVCGWIDHKDEFGKWQSVWGKVSGLNNIGLLIIAWGKYAYVDSSTFTIDDGSNINVKCIIPTGVTLDRNWGHVRVTGISSCEKVHVDDHDELHGIIRIRGRKDIVSLH